MFNSKGQSSSVFNLLIAALVSIAILGLLLAIMGGIGFNAGNDPSETTINQIKTASNGNSDYTTKASEITFTKTANQIVRATLIESTSIGKNIKLTTCEGLSTSRFDTSNESIIKYTGTSDLDSMVYAICGSDSSLIEESFSGCQGADLALPNDGYGCVVIVGPKK